mmetsp:Transcript_5382/g.16376  ORF Transcript_5382/g.16376 Transcript_5382/m.16376 type:complete len:236 (+) Transcript_5382:1892-2599(+)
MTKRASPAATSRQRAVAAVTPSRPQSTSSAARFARSKATISSRCSRRRVYCSSALVEVSAISVRLTLSPRGMIDTLSTGGVEGRHTATSARAASLKATLRRTVASCSGGSTSPDCTFSIASSISRIEMRSRLFRTVRMVASFQTLAKSAPLMPGVTMAARVMISSRFSSDPTGRLRACTRRIASRARRSGSSTGMILSMRPLRTSASSSVSTRLVAPRHRMLVSCVSKPSSSTSS